MVMKVYSWWNVPVTIYSICYIALENNALHKFKVNKINLHTDNDGYTIETCFLTLKKSHYFLKFLQFCCFLDIMAINIDDPSSGWGIPIILAWTGMCCWTVYGFQGVEA